MRWDNNKRRKVRYLYDRLIQEGFNDILALSVIGNIDRESGFNDFAQNPTSSARYIMQWLGDRRKRLEAMYGFNPSYENQVEFLINEIKGDEYSGWNFRTGSGRYNDSLGAYQASRQEWMSSTTLYGAIDFYEGGFGRSNRHKGEHALDDRVRRALTAAKEIGVDVSNINIGSGSSGNSYSAPRHNPNTRQNYNVAAQRGVGDTRVIITHHTPREIQRDNVFSSSGDASYGAVGRRAFGGRFRRTVGGGDLFPRVTTDGIIIPNDTFINNSDSITLRDNRTIRAATGNDLPLNHRKDLKTARDEMEMVIEAAIRHNVNPLTLEAMRAVESEFGRKDPHNSLQLNDDAYKLFTERTGFTKEDFSRDRTSYLKSYYDFVAEFAAMKFKPGQNNNREESRIIQNYNGMGVIKPTARMDSIYGLPIPPEGIDMREAQYYGKEVIDIRDNVLSADENYMNVYNEIYNKIKNPKRAKINDEFTKPLYHQPDALYMKRDYYPRYIDINENNNNSNNNTMRRAIGGAMINSAQDISGSSGYAGIKNTSSTWSMLQRRKRRTTGGHGNVATSSNYSSGATSTTARPNVVRGSGVTFTGSPKDLESAQAERDSVNYNWDRFRRMSPATDSMYATMQNVYGIKVDMKRVRANDLEYIEELERRAKREHENRIIHADYMLAVNRGENPNHPTYSGGNLDEVVVTASRTPRATTPAPTPRATTPAPTPRATTRTPVTRREETLNVPRHTLSVNEDRPDVQDVNVNPVDTSRPLTKKEARFQNRMYKAMDKERMKFVKNSRKWYEENYGKDAVAAMVRDVEAGDKRFVEQYIATRRSPSRTRRAIGGAPQMYGQNYMNEDVQEVPGGYIEQVGTDGEVYYGATHEQQQPNGVPGATGMYPPGNSQEELEGGGFENGVAQPGEVVWTNDDGEEYIFTNRLPEEGETFSEIAKKILEEKEELEKAYAQYLDAAQMELDGVGTTTRSAFDGTRKRNAEKISQEAQQLAQAIAERNDALETLKQTQNDYAMQLGLYNPDGTPKDEYMAAFGGQRKKRWIPIVLGIASLAMAGVQAGMSAKQARDAEKKAMQERQDNLADAARESGEQAILADQRDIMNRQGSPMIESFYKYGGRANMKCGGRRRRAVGSIANNDQMGDYLTWLSNKLRSGVYNNTNYEDFLQEVNSNNMGIASTNSVTQTSPVSNTPNNNNNPLYSKEIEDRFSKDYAKWLKKGNIGDFNAFMEAKGNPVNQANTKTTSFKPGASDLFSVGAQAITMAGNIYSNKKLAKAAEIAGKPVYMAMPKPQQMEMYRNTQGRVLNEDMFKSTVDDVSKNVSTAQTRMALNQSARNQMFKNESGIRQEEHGINLGIQRDNANRYYAHQIAERNEYLDYDADRRQAAVSSIALQSQVNNAANRDVSQFLTNLGNRYDNYRYANLIATTNPDAVNVELYRAMTGKAKYGGRRRRAGGLMLSGGNPGSFQFKEKPQVAFNGLRRSIGGLRQRV